MKRLFFLTILALPLAAHADVRLSRLFSDHMVLQRDKPVPIWGWADAGEEITVEFAGQSVRASAGADGAWKATLQPLQASAEPRILTAKGKNAVQVADVLVGEVWICSGQSNMGMTVGGSLDADLEALTAARLSQLRLLTLSTPGTQESIKEPDQDWKTCTPDNIKAFSAVGFFFGRQLHDTLGIPVGLINNSWGGSACEAWIRRDLLEKSDLYQPLLARWQQIEKDFDYEKVKADHRKAVEDWKKKVEEAKAQGKPAPAPPRGPQNQLTGQGRPANLYHGRLKPLLGMAMRGVVWYQGETNAGRAYQYREMFPLMIRNWRDDWNQGEFPFYWAQLADFKAETKEPGDEPWAELREAQTMTLAKLPNTGQAVITDLGEANDIHPRRKMEVGRRLARLALAKDYGIKIECESPQFSAMEKKDGKVIVSFKNAGQGGLKALDVGEIRGFAIAGEDRKWKWAQAKIAGPDKIEVSSPDVPAPVAVRYAWADNPVCNLFSRAGLPVTPFRTDDWPGVTANER
jgi:sialate O-acetylesterase